MKKNDESKIALDAARRARADARPAELRARTAGILAEHTRAKARAAWDAYNKIEAGDERS